MNQTAVAFLLLLSAAIVPAASRRLEHDDSGGGWGYAPDCAGTIVELAVGTPDLSTLVAAVTAADLVETLSGDGPFTVFAPTNDAFAALPKGTLDSLLLPENIKSLTDILLYHVVPGSVLSTDLSNGPVETLNGDAVEVHVSKYGIMINDANVIIADIIACNGVVHVIDAVLLPPEEPEPEPEPEPYGKSGKGSKGGYGYYGKSGKGSKGGYYYEPEPVPEPKEPGHWEFVYYPAPPEPYWPYPDPEPMPEPEPEPHGYYYGKTGKGSKGYGYDDDGYYGYGKGGKGGYYEPEPEPEPHYPEPEPHWGEPKHPEPAPHPEPEPEPYGKGGGYGYGSKGSKGGYYEPEPELEPMPEPEPHYPEPQPHWDYEPEPWGKPDPEPEPWGKPEPEPEPYGKSGKGGGYGYGSKGSKGGYYEPEPELEPMPEPEQHYPEPQPHWDYEPEPWGKPEPEPEPWGKPEQEPEPMPEPYGKSGKGGGYGYGHGGKSGKGSYNEPEPEPEPHYPEPPAPKPKPSDCAGTIVELAVGTPDLSTLVAAVTAADLVETLSGDGPFTVFAPTNDAFAALPKGTLDSLLLPENIKSLTDILLYHVVSGTVLSTDLSNGPVETLNGATVEVKVSKKGVMINDANVVIADIIACNGVVHVIDAVLLPPEEKKSHYSEEMHFSQSVKEESTSDAHISHRLLGAILSVVSGGAALFLL